MKRKLIAATLAATLILSTACNSKKDTKDTKSSRSKAETEDVSETEDEETEKATEATEDTSEASTEATTEATTEETTEATTEATTAPEEVDHYYDLSDMTAEEIFNIVDAIRNKPAPAIGRDLEEVRKEYFEVQPNAFSDSLEQMVGRYTKTDGDFVVAIYYSGVYPGREKHDDPLVIDRVEDYGTGIILEIHDPDKATEVIQIIKDKYGVESEKPGGGFAGDNYVVGSTYNNYMNISDGLYIQIAFTEGSIWYKSVAGVFGFGSIV